MKFDNVLNESYPRAILTYKGTREDYKINDNNPYIIMLDQSYNVDGNGESILGLNLNYFKGDVADLIKKINKFDNESGFRGFEGKLKVKKFLKQNDVEGWEEGKRKTRFNNLMSQFPYLKKYIRRYKKSGPKGSGIKSKKRKVLK